MRVYSLISTFDVRFLDKYNTYTSYGSFSKISNRKKINIFLAVQFFRNSDHHIILVFEILEVHFNRLVFLSLKNA